MAAAILPPPTRGIFQSQSADIDITRANPGPLLAPWALIPRHSTTEVRSHE